MDAVGTAFEKVARLDHVGAVLADAEDAVGQQAEVAGSGIRDHAHLLLSVLDVMPDRRAVGMVHPGVHREGQPPTVGPQHRLELAELAIGHAVGIGTVKPQILARGCHLAGRVAVSVMRDAFAGHGAGAVGQRRDAGSKRAGEQRQRAQRSALHVAAHRLVREEPAVLVELVERVVQAEAQFGRVFQRQPLADSAAYFAGIAVEQVERSCRSRCRRVAAT